MSYLVSMLLTVFLCIQTTYFLELTDGRKLPILGEYHVKGDFVQFTTIDGNLSQLPLDQVDLTRTEASWPAEVQKDEAAKESSHKIIELDNKGLQTFVEKNPVAESNDVQVQAVENDTHSSKSINDYRDQKRLNRDYGRQLKAARAEIESLQERIESHKRQIESQFMSLSTIAWHEDRIDDLKAQIEQQRREYRKLQSQARKAGAKSRSY